MIVYKFNPRVVAHGEFRTRGSFIALQIAKQISKLSEDEFKCNHITKTDNGDFRLSFTDGLVLGIKYTEIDGAILSVLELPDPSHFYLLSKIWEQLGEPSAAIEPVAATYTANTVSDVKQPSASKLNIIGVLKKCASLFFGKRR